MHQPRAQHSAPPRALTWAQEHRILLGSAAVAAACATIAVVGQIDFYRSIPHLPTVIAYLFPIGVEAISWVMGATAAYCVQQNLPSAKYSRRMWAFAAFAAAVNTWHGIQHLGVPSVGIVLGLASLFGPFVWHSYTGMTRAALSGRTFEQIKVAAKTRLLHPWLSWRADRVQTLLQCTRSEAWMYALGYRHGAVREMAAAELQRQLGGRPMTVLSVAQNALPDSRPATATATRRGATANSATRGTANRANNTNEVAPPATATSATSPGSGAIQIVVQSATEPGEKVAPVADLATRRRITAASPSPGSGNKTEIMRRVFDEYVKAGRLDELTGAELARHAGAHPSLGRKYLSLWISEVEGRVVEGGGK